MTALYNFLETPSRQVTPWKGLDWRACDWCGRERTARLGSANTCRDCHHYDVYAQAVEAGEAS
ncbi:MAG TPA: hypothetical protein VK054_13775 [Beutenbergiaceae bacterium]|nr:hypothetical protein [Beutenbergiaceae bacterium]